MRKIDHIAYAVPNLQDGCSQLEELLGCKVTIGGRHLNNGTHNALINLGSEIYLEVLAIDHDNKEITSPRWMGVDLISEPKITRWAMKTNDLPSDLTVLKMHHPEHGESFEGSRVKQDGSILQWNMAIPTAAPAVDLAPFAVDWKDSIHPTLTLPDECTLMEMELMHPTPSRFDKLFERLNIELKVKQGTNAEIKLKINCPNGIIELS